MLHLVGFHGKMDVGDQNMRQKSLEERQAMVARMVAERTATQPAAPIAQPIVEPIAMPSAKRTPRETALENLRLANLKLAAKRSARDPWLKHETNAQRCARYRAKQKRLRQQRKEAGQP